MNLPRRWIILIVAIVVAVPVGWYLLSPLFITRPVDEALPTGLPGPAVSFNGSQATAAMGTAEAQPGNAMDEPMPQADMSTTAIMYQGYFYSVVHEGQGVAKLYQRLDGTRFLRLEDFEVVNGPDLHVWLVPVDPVTDTAGVEIPGYYDLGPLKGNQGNQNYDVPADLDLTAYKSIVIWCAPFRVPFSAAPLGST
jgi:Electron transfer DM13